MNQRNILCHYTSPAYIRQERDYDCGPVALHNAVWAMGKEIIISRKKAEYLTDVDGDGTSEAGILSALESLRVDYHSMFTTVGAKASRELDAALARGPVIACCSGWDHWVTVIGYNKAYGLLVIDPKDGPHLFGRRQFMEYWYCKRGYYLIGLEG